MFLTFNQISPTDTNQLQPTNLLTRSCQKGNWDSRNGAKPSPHRLHTSTTVTFSPLTWKAGAVSIISTWHEAFWPVETKLKWAVPVPRVDSNKKSPRDVGGGLAFALRVRRMAAVRGPLKKHGHGRVPLTRGTFKFRACETCPVEWKQLASSSSHSSKWQHLATWKWMNK